jgi:hypothetical protein
VNRLPYADQVIVLGDSATNIEACSLSELLLRGNTYLSSLDPAEPKWESQSQENIALSSDEESDQSANDVMITADRETLQSTEARMSSDFSLYKFYLGSVSLPTSVAFILMISVFVFCHSFPSTINPSYANLVSLTDDILDIWLKWWAEFNTLHPNRNIGKWLGVYVTLGILTIASLVAGSWYVVIELSAIQTLTRNKAGIHSHDTGIRPTLSFYFIEHSEEVGVEAVLSSRN